MVNFQPGWTSIYETKEQFQALNKYVGWVWKDTSNQWESFISIGNDEGLLFYGDEGIFKGKYPHDFSRGFAAPLSLFNRSWDDMFVYLSNDLPSIILWYFGFLGIWLGSS